MICYSLIVRVLDHLGVKVKIEEVITGVVLPRTRRSYCGMDPLYVFTTCAMNNINTICTPSFISSARKEGTFYFQE